MHLQVLGSGSGGNALLVRAGELRCLVDAGLPLDELERRLEAARQPLRTLDAIALTHGHLDHARAAGALARKSGARVFCSQALFSNASLRPAPTLGTLRIGGEIELRARRARDVLRLKAVALPHDADPTVAFRLEHEGRRAVVLTDMGRPDRAVARELSGAHLLLLEFNHDPERLQQGPYPPALRRRIAGPRGHLSNAQAAEMLRWLAGAELHTLLLAHLSLHNNSPEQARAAAEVVLRELGREDVRVLACEPDRIGPNLAV
jgi:phosphoribosyl 1,2-cyclic phosphodiesterase